MKRATFLFIILISLYGKAMAQFGAASLSDYEKLKNRKLLVILEEPYEKLIKKLDEEQKKVYLQEIIDYNSMIKWAMDNYYKIPHPFEYKKRSEVEKLIKAKSKEYVYLYNTKFSDIYYSKLNFQLMQKNRLADQQSRLSGAISKEYLMTSLDIRFTDQSEMADPFYGQYLPFPFPTKAEMAYAVKQINSILSYREQGIGYEKTNDLDKINSKELQTLTLLVAEEDLDPNDDKNKFISTYKYTIEIVPQTKVDEAIINGDATKACIMRVLMHGVGDGPSKFVFRAFNCATGIHLAESNEQDKAGVAAGPMIGFKNLKKAVESKLPPIRKENLWDFNHAAK